VKLTERIAKAKMVSGSMVKASSTCVVLISPIPAATRAPSAVPTTRSAERSHVAEK